MAGRYVLGFPERSRRSCDRLWSCGFGLERRGRLGGGSESLIRVKQEKAMSKKTDPKKATRGAQAETSHLHTVRRPSRANTTMRGATTAVGPLSAVHQVQALGGAPAVAGSTLAAPYWNAQGAHIKWRLQTYSGAPLGAHVIKPQIEAFNKAANGEMEIELYYADQLVPTSELFRALQSGTIDAVQSDDATMASPVDISVFGGYFPFSTRYSLDLPVLFQRYGLNEIWTKAYDEVEGVEWLSAGAWDPCHIFTKEPVRSLADMNGKRVFGVPTAGRFLARYGLIPVTVPWDDVEVAIQTGELDGVAWCGFNETSAGGWAGVSNSARLKKQHTH